ncbi:MAG TPA: sugar phosphate isomerase/epimerase [Desulfurococcales archaeon]|nr:sugar phosphate isomerase/epimerase [Desulfurococcales archaeon]
MKLGVSIWCLPKPLRNPYEFMAKAKEIGYDGVELAIVDEDLELSSSERTRKWKSILEKAKTLDIEIPSIASGLYWRYNMVTDGESALKVLKIQCEVAATVNAHVVLVIPGVAVSEINYLEHFTRVARVLKKASKIAEDYNVIIGLEPSWNRLFPSPLDFKKLIDEVGEKNVKVYFDVGNTLPHSLPEHWIRILGKDIVQVHVKDFNIDELKFGIPQTGSINWDAVKTALWDIGYQGYLVAEVPWDMANPYKPLYEVYIKMREIFL